MNPELKFSLYNTVSPAMLLTHYDCMSLHDMELLKNMVTVLHTRNTSLTLPELYALFPDTEPSLLVRAVSMLIQLRMGQLLAATDPVQEPEQKPATPFYVVWVKPGTAPGSHNSPHKKHPTYEDAEKEALRLGLSFPNSKTYILAPVAQIKTQVKVTAHTELLCRL